MKRLRLLLLFAIFLTLAPVSAFAATAGATKVADPSSASTWRNWGLENSTENVGRIWTDKTVSNGNIVLSGADGDMTIEKDDRLGFPDVPLRNLLHIEPLDDVHDAARHRARARCVGVDGRSHGKQ